MQIALRRRALAARLLIVLHRMTAISWLPEGKTKSRGRAYEVSFLIAPSFNA